MSEQAETQQENPTYTDEQIDQRIEDLDLAGAALRTIWDDVEAANNAIRRAQSHLSELQSETGYSKDMFGEGLHFLDRKLDESRLGFIEQHFAAAGRNYRKAAGYLRRARREGKSEDEIQFLAEFYGQMGSPKEDKR